MSTAALDRREALCTEIIRDAGALALDRFRDRSAVRMTLKGSQDYLTETDGEVERLIAGRLRTAFPDDGFLGVEGGGADASRLWVVDPIDGTANFARFVPHFCVSMAYLENGRTEIGAIFSPATDELFVARRGRGGTCNGRRMQVAETNGFAATTIEIGWSSRLPNAVSIDLVAKTLERGANVRRGGSGCLGIAYVADGRIDAYAELHTFGWDCLAGLLMVEEAGGRVSRFVEGGFLLTGGPVLAAAPGVAAPMSEISGIGLG
jgi:myo-inositol-1(or 4)-monophosphatase